MKTIENIFIEIENKAFFEAAKEICEVEYYKDLNPRMTVSAARRYLVIEFPEYSGHDKHKAKQALEHYFDFANAFGQRVAKYNNITFLTTK